MEMNTASDEDQLAQEGFVKSEDCLRCELLLQEIKRLRERGGGRAKCGDCGDSFEPFEVPLVIQALAEWMGFSTLCGECLVAAAAEKIDALTKQADSLRDGWKEFLVNDICGLCENTGRFHLRTTEWNERRHEEQTLHIPGVPCICPKGRAIKAAERKSGPPLDTIPPARQALGRRV